MGELHWKTWQRMKVSDWDHSRLDLQILRLISRIRLYYIRVTVSSRWSHGLDVTWRGVQAGHGKLRRSAARIRRSDFHS